MTEEIPDPAKPDPRLQRKLPKDRTPGSDKDAKLAAALRSNLSRRKAAARILSKADRG